VLIVVAATFVVARIERKKLLFYGYLRPHNLSRLIAGAVWGVTALSAMIAALSKAKVITFHPFQASSANVWTAGVGWAFLFLLVGIWKEWKSAEGSGFPPDLWIKLIYMSLTKKDLDQ